MQRDFYSARDCPAIAPPRTQADLASWNVNLTQRKVALNADTMNEFSEY